MAIYFSLSDYWVGSPGGFVGLGNYRDILGNEIFRQTVQNSFVFTGIALTLKAVLGVWLAHAAGPQSHVQAADPRRRAAAVGHPHRAVHAGVGVDVRLALQRRELDGDPPGPDRRAPGPTGSGMSTYAMAAVITVNVWRGLPFFAITVLAGLVSIPREFYEAAEVDGASRARASGT